VTIDTWINKTATGEDFAIDLLDVFGDIVLRLCLKLAHTKDGKISPSDCKIICNSYDARQQKWGASEATPAPKCLTVEPLPHPIPVLSFERKADCWEISVREHAGKEDLTRICTFKHRPTMGGAAAGISERSDGTTVEAHVCPPVAIRVSDNCSGGKIETITHEDVSRETWMASFTENKLMKLKLEFWSHDTKDGLGMLDGEEQDKKGAMDHLGDAAGKAMAFVGGIWTSKAASSGEADAASATSATLAIEDTAGAEAASP